MLSQIYKIQQYFQGSNNFKIHDQMLSTLKCHQTNYCSSLFRLDYQQLFGKGARAPPRTHGWTHGLSIVNFDQ